MLERIVFHIGMHKTGTTAIQVSLGKAYDSLLSRGILYPRAGRVGPGHAQVARDLLRTDAPAAELPSHLGILDEVRTAGPATLIVSSEDLLGVRSPRPVEWARHLCEELQPARVDVLGYVRPQWDQVESLYAASVRTGRSWAPFDQVLETMMVDRRFDYLETFSSWRQAFGDRLELRPYGADVLVGGDAVTDFWSSVGLGTPTEPPRHANPRSGARTTEMLRLLRAFLADHHLDMLVPQPAEPSPRRQQEAVQETLRRARRRIEAAFDDDRPFSPLTQEMLVRLAAHFAASNERLVETYLAGRHASLFSPPSEPREHSTWSLSDASEEERRFFAQLIGETLLELRPDRRGARGLRRARGRLGQLISLLRKG